MRFPFKNTKVLNPAVILIILIILFVAASIFILFFQNKSKSTPSENQALQNGKYSTIYHFDNQKPDTSKGSVEAKSEIKGQMVEILSQKNLIDMLDSWRVYGKNYDFGKDGHNTENVSKVIFTLVDKPEKSVLYPQLGDFRQASFFLTAEKNELDVHIYIAPDNLTNANNFFTSQALYYFYFTYQRSKGVSDTLQLNQNFNNLVIDLTKSQPLFVVYQVGYK
jgi:hypothetical protein